MPSQSRVREEFSRAVREAMGELSQSEAALRSEISVGYINRMVRGTVPSPRIILQFAAALQADPAPLLRSAGYDDLLKARQKGEDLLLGPDAAAQCYRQTWDQIVSKLYPDEEMPALAVLPRTRSAIRRMVTDRLLEIMEDREEV